ncbi:MAG TPA: helix-turn-helix domain-containing protein [Pseudonocardia sp.]|nr:helix-turn-helix domain-containing protein [Pseudonocardia sp.]
MGSPNHPPPGTGGGPGPSDPCSGSSGERPDPPASGGKPEATPDLLNINEVAGMLRVSKMTVYRFIRDGRLSAVRIGNSLRVYRTDLNQYLASAYLPTSKTRPGTPQSPPPEV